jgi:hypothetical protein
MNKAVKAVLQVICSIALIVAAIPFAAAEAVCVMPSALSSVQERVVPMAKCGMPCCSHGEMPTCCRHSASAAACHAAANSGGLKKSCRCETRVHGVSGAGVRQIHRVSLPLPSVQAILCNGLVLASPELVGSLRPVLCGSDSSPPPKSLRLPDLGRAPPAS